MPVLCRMSVSSLRIWFDLMLSDALFPFFNYDYKPITIYI